MSLKKKGEGSCPPQRALGLGSAEQAKCAGAEWARERRSCRQQVEGRERRPQKPALHLGEIQDFEDQSDRI